MGTPGGGLGVGSGSRAQVRLPRPARRIRRGARGGGTRASTARTSTLRG